MVNSDSCKKCDVIFDTVEIAATGHEVDEWKVEKNLPRRRMAQESDYAKNAIRPLLRLLMLH